MNLSDLLSSFSESFQISGTIDCDINGISCDSRKVNPGNLFIALRGGQDRIVTNLLSMRFNAVLLH